VLYGSPKTAVEREGTSDTYIITVPPDARLPKGRTSIILVANNGTYDSNPLASTSIARRRGQPPPDPRRRVRRRDLPGEKVRFDLKGSDPEGFAVSFSRSSGQVGTLKGNTFTWDCPGGTPDGVYPVALFASDGTGGTNSRQVSISVVSTRAKLTADKTAGPAPLAVKFSGAGRLTSRRTRWRIDGNSTTAPCPPRLSRHTHLPIRASIA